MACINALSLPYSCASVVITHSFLVDSTVSIICRRHSLVAVRTFIRLCLSRCSASEAAFEGYLTASFITSDRPSVTQTISGLTEIAGPDVDGRRGEKRPRDGVSPVNVQLVSDPWTKSGAGMGVW